MIGSLRGTIIERSAAGDTAVEIIVDVGGVGYRVLVSSRLAVSLGPVRTDAAGSGSSVALSIHTHVREGAITLYGFADAAERRAFEILLAAHGVGPALALAIISVHGPDRLVEIVANDDIDALTLVPGVGRKTAMRLLVDLKSRFGELDGVSLPAMPLLNGTPSAQSEVSEALAQLGYGPEEVRAAVRALPAEGTVEELLRAALRQLAHR